MDSSLLLFVPIGLVSFMLKRWYVNDKRASSRKNCIRRLIDQHGVTEKLMCLATNINKDIQRQRCFADFIAKYTQIYNTHEDMMFLCQYLCDNTICNFSKNMSLSDVNHTPKQNTISGESKHRHEITNEQVENIEFSTEDVLAKNTCADSSCVDSNSTCTQEESDSSCVDSNSTCTQEESDSSCEEESDSSCEEDGTENKFETDDDDKYYSEYDRDCEEDSSESSFSEEDLDNCETNHISNNIQEQLHSEINKPCEEVYPHNTSNIDEDCLSWQDEQNFNELDFPFI